MQINGLSAWWKGGYEKKRKNLFAKDNIIL